MQTEHEQFMRRCLQLAKLGLGRVAPNPMVGAVLVYNGRIIGEGWHKQWGGPHAEVECVASVKPADRHLIADATMYVSLEPCAHWGKTPPCADLILKHNIRNVVVGSRDPFQLVDGKGIERMQAAGVAVTTGVLEKECLHLNRRFFLFHTAHRPYIVLKWAQTGNGKISGSQGRRLMISNAYSNRMVHKWRAAESAILVGTNTALADDPALTTRHWPGNNPIRLVTDLHERLPQNLQLFNGNVPTIVFSLHRHTIENRSQLQNGGVFYYQVSEDASLVHQILNALYQLGIQSLFVEGGAQLLQSFITEGLWDEAHVITNESLAPSEGLPAPVLSNQQLVSLEQLQGDIIRSYTRQA